MKSLLIFILIVFSQLALGQKLILLHTNDHHGAFMTSVDGDYGFAQQMTYIEEVRAEARRTGATVILLSAGDINTGPPESNHFRAKPDFEAMNMMGFDAMSPGNHEFDRAREVLEEQRRMAKFPFLASNIVDLDGKPAFGETKIIEIAGGKKVGIIGYTTPDTPKITPKANSAHLRFLDPWERGAEIAKRLKKETDMVIGLSHLGYFENESHGVNAPGDETLAKRVPDHDLIVGGHTHTKIQKPVRIGNTNIVQAQESGFFVGRADYDFSSGKPVLDNYQLVEIKGFKAHPKMVELLQPYLDEGKRQFSRVVGKATTGFEGNRADFVKSERPTGNFAAEAQRVAANADIGLVRGKGLRSGFEAGDVQLRNLLSLTPLGHNIVTAELNGAEVWRFANAMKDNMLVNGNRPYVSKGFKVDIQDGVIKSVSLNGKEIPNTPTGKFKISTTDAIVETFQPFNFIGEHPTYKQTGLIDVDATEAYMKKVGTLDSKDLQFGTFEPAKAPPVAGPKVLPNEASLVTKLKDYKASVLFIGHGSKGQYKDVEAIKKQIDKTVKRLDDTYGKGKWAAVFGGDNFSPDKPDISHVLKHLKDKHKVPLVAIQSDVVIPWGGVDKHVDFVHYMPTVEVPALDESGKQIIENGKPKTKTHWGGFIDGKPRGPTEIYLGDSLIGGKEPILRETIAIGGGPIGLDEAKYAYEHGVKVSYIKAETRFPEVNGKYGPVDSWVKSIAGNSARATSLTLPALNSTPGAGCAKSAIRGIIQSL